ncbi:MAG TPA: CBS domain-containing protein [Burkholderiales bacterium]|nr:CBS domain-containing protein [Burkholderiales bacterium]
MDRQYHALPIRELGEGAGYRRPVQARPARVTLESPAREVMTDLQRTAPATIRSQAPVEGANQYMISRGVRLLLVADARDVVEGLITATDILGVKAVQIMTERGIARHELTVRDLMTPTEHVEVLDYADVDGARVGHVLETLRKAGRQHALVVDYDVIPPQRLIDQPVRRAMVRGIFSLSQLARQLGVTLQTGGAVALTFSEVESALGR